LTKFTSKKIVLILILGLLFTFEVSIVQPNSYSKFKSLFIQQIESDNITEAEIMISRKSLRFYATQEIKEDKELLSNIQISKFNFDEGMSYFNDEKFTLAIKSFSKVSELDRNRYGKSLQKIEESEKLILRQQKIIFDSGIALAEELSLAGEHAKALNELSRIAYLTGDFGDFTALKYQIINQLREENKADKLKAEAAGKAMLGKLRRVSRKDPWGHSSIFYYDKSTIVSENRDAFYAFIKEWTDNSDSQLGIRVQHAGDYRLFIQRAILSVDYNDYTIFDGKWNWYKSKKYKNYEWAESSSFLGLSGISIDILHQISKSYSTSITFLGSAFKETRVLTSQEKRALSNVLIAYEYLKKD
jgi:hypothetical protein